MSRTLRPLIAAGTALAAAVTLAACGGDSIPGDSVARVGDVSIHKDTFDHWKKIAAIATAQQSDPTAAASGKTPAYTLPDGPDYVKCIAAKKKAAGKPAKGQKVPTDAEYKQQCQTEDKQLTDQVMQVLINAEWINGESSEQDLKVSDATVKKQLDTQIQQAFPDRSQFTSYIKSSGYTMADLILQQRSQAQQEALVTKLEKGVTNAKIAEYYNGHKSQFAQPERRDLRVVLTKPSQEARAKQAKAALESGQSWKTVAAKYSIDQASKSTGGVLTGISKGQQEKALDDAVFTAKTGEVSGPVKTQFGYYVFEVTKVTPPAQQSLQQATPQIKQTLQQQIVTKFATDYQKRWTAKTYCRAAYVATGCSEAPKTASTAAAGAAQVPAQ